MIASELNPEPPLQVLPEILPEITFGVLPEALPGTQPDALHQSDHKPFEPLLNVAQIAEILGVCPANVYRMCRKNAIPHIRVLRKSYRFRLSAIEAWIADKMKQSITKPKVFREGKQNKKGR